MGDDEKSSLILLTDNEYPRFEVPFPGYDAHRPAIDIDADEFIGVKSFKARGKRLTTFQLGSVTELEPEPTPEDAPEAEDAAIEDVEAEEIESDDSDSNTGSEA